jgi:hypothetical protein
MEELLTLSNLYHSTKQSRKMLRMRYAVFSASKPASGSPTKCYIRSYSHKNANNVEILLPTSISSPANTCAFFASQKETAICQLEPILSNEDTELTINKFKTCLI